MMKVLCSAVAIYAIVGVATAVTLLASWVYERYVGAYRNRREELPLLWEVLLFCLLCWPLVVYALAAVAVARASRPRG